MFNFLYSAVSWVLLRWHSFFSLFLDKNSGLNWSLSIVFLVVTARLLLFRLFIKQIKYQRHMQEMQPKIQALRKKHKDDKAEMQRQMMKLQQEEGFNPLAGCLPIFIQIPIFIGLFHVLRHLSNSVVIANKALEHAPLTPKQVHNLHLYTFTQSETISAAKANLFGAPLAGRLTDTSNQIHLLGGNTGTTRIVIVLLVIVSAAATLFTQLLVRRGTTTVAEGTAATVQRLMLVFIPISTLGSGLFFPLGVLLYWFTSNTWTMAQQLYVNRFHPHTPKEAPVVGELGKTLAPKPGQRPNRAPVALTKSDADDEQPPAPTRSTPPRPGQRPNRSGNRPPAKRPSQAKKRR
ncbi:MAG TPA: membrane protein insertase YidC [Jatrophihabitantaceae bacterium]|jgi:YidC/Oxa1 family membrane protein insertase|nr:membrane protein insertase YidC [Jatrophihabitantaceae bacterium]